MTERKTRMWHAAGTIATNIKLPKELHAQLGKAAQEACRSANGELIFRLRQSFSAEAAK